jgi:CubicO group peptidase (beta-lactamase class C family)
MIAMELRRGNAREAGLDPERLKRASAMLAGWSETGQVPGSALAVVRNGILAELQGIGRRSFPGGNEPMAAETVFLVASVTKPLTAAAAMLLIERGLLVLDDPVCAMVPEFTGGGKEKILVRHLLTHTSGLPDMLPENLELRRCHAPLSEFVARICRCGLLFEPGSQIRYQSMGIAMLAELVERISGRPLRQFLEQEIFSPLGMGSTSLGIRAELRERLALVQLPEEQRETDWHWNSDYWQNLGAPWGGMFATVEDLAVLLAMFLNQGEYGGRQVLGALTVRAMTADRTSSLPRLSEESRRSQAWGLGWKIGWCDLSSPASYQHAGATGTLVGADPETGLACAIFTTQPGAPLHYIANIVNAAVI